VEELLADAGFDTRHLRVEGSPAAVYGEQRGRSDHTLLLYNHYDVQPADPLELWDSPPSSLWVPEAHSASRGYGPSSRRPTCSTALFASRHRYSATASYLSAIHESLGELRVLPQDFALERVTLLAAHRRDIKRIVRRADGFEGLLWPLNM
jgi:hypothetical protein